MIVFLRLSEANRKKHMQHSPWSKMWSVEYMEYSQALLLIILDAPQFCQHLDLEPVGTTPNLRTECHRFWKLLILDSETHTVRAPCWNWLQVVPFLSPKRNTWHLLAMPSCCACHSCMFKNQQQKCINSIRKAGSKGSAPYLHLQTHGDPHFPFLALVSIFTFCTASTSDMPYEVTLLMSGHRELLTLSDRKFWTSCVCRQCMSYLESPMKEEQKYITEKGLELRPIFQVSKNMIICAHYAGSMICTFLVLHIPSFAQIFHSALWCPVSNHSDLQLEN